MKFGMGRENPSEERLLKIKGKRGKEAGKYFIR